MSKKTCISCHKTKPFAEFYSHKKMADGYLNKCKECVKAYSRKRRFDPDCREKILAYDRARGYRQGTEYQKRRRLENPEKYKANYMISNALRGGRLLKPEVCAHCSTATSRIEAHHPDYSRPLEVVWLCSQCHSQLHAFEKTVSENVVKAESPD